MLTTILHILSIIGWILLGLLGFLVILLLLVLFFPIFYDAFGLRSTDIPGKVRLQAGWLFGLLRVRYTWPEEDGRVQVKLLFFTLYDSKAPKKKSPVDKEESEPDLEAPSSESGSSQQTVLSEKKSMAAKKQPTPVKEQTKADREKSQQEEARPSSSQTAYERLKHMTSEETRRNKAESLESLEVKQDDTNIPKDSFKISDVEQTLKDNQYTANMQQTMSSSQEGTDTEQAENDHQENTGAEQTQDACQENVHTEHSTEASSESSAARTSIFDKILNLYHRFRYTISHLCATIKKLKGQADYYLALLQEEETRQLFSHVKLRLFKVFRSIRPRKIKGHVTFGTGSPDTTGYGMAVYGMLSPLLGKDILVTPDFEEACLYGEVRLKGHITIGVLLFQGLRLLLDKKLRRFIKKMKQGGSDNGR